MVERIRQTNVLTIVVATVLVVLAASVGRAWAQGAGTSLNGNASPPSASGSNQERDAGERGRRGPGGGRFGGGRGGDNGTSDNSNTPPAKTTAPPATPASPELSEADRIRAWAKKIIQEHDKNSNMMLEESEWEGLGQSVKADTNGDHVITMDELIAFASRKPGTPPAATSPASPPSAESKVATAEGPAASDHGNKFVNTSSNGPSESKSAKGKPKSYRFKTAKERLPAGLPGWFTSKDANGDGQVEMSEYSHSWSESTAAEFKRYDHDNDGIITAEEALKK